VSIDAARLRATIPFFKEIAPDVLDHIIPFMYEKTFKKGSIIFFEGDEGDEIFFIRSGAVNIHSFDGVKKVILAFLQEGDYFGEMALIKPGLYRSATAETTQLTRLYTLRRNDFEKLIMDNPTLAFHLLGDTMERLRRANQQIYDLTFLNVRTRIVKRLIRLSEEFGATTPQGVRIELKITHQQMAEMVGAVRETVTKVLLELQESGLIRIRDKKILLPDPDLLERKLREEN